MRKDERVVYTVSWLYFMGINVRVVFTDQASTANIYTPTNLEYIYMLQKGCYFTKIKSAKTFLTVNPQKIPITCYKTYPL